MKTIITFVLGLVLVSGELYAEETGAEACHSLLNFEATKLRTTESINFCEQFKGKALLVVNTASKCGFTPQFKGLEKLHKKYGESLAIVGFPSDDFRQEHNDSEKVAEVCFINYGVTFTILEPSAVKGPNANALFKALSEKTGKEPGWNFSKYLVSADGSKVDYFSSKVKPSDAKLVSAIEAAL